MYDVRASPHAGHRLRWSIPARVALRGGPVSYQRNRPTGIVEPASRTAQPADGALFRTNSSTFGTLLSSQGSSAHSNLSLSAWLEDNLQKLTGPVRASQLGLPGVGESCRTVPATLPSHVARPCVPPLSG